MAITKQKKAEIMNDLVAKFKEAKSIWFATTNTVTVKEFARLRKSLREINASYTLAKKTIIKKALKEALDIDVDTNSLEWQIWIVCSNDDSIVWLSKVNIFMKEVNWPKWKLGKLVWSISIFEGELKTIEETKVLASLPTKETLLSRLVGSMKSPISALARFFDATKKELETKWINSVWDLKNATPKKEETAKTEGTKVSEIPVWETPKEEIKIEVPVSVEWDKIEATITPIEETKEEISTTNKETEDLTQVSPAEENATNLETPTSENEEKKAETTTEKKGE